MRKPVVFMFSGQGSHYFQMGRELYQENPTFKKWMDILDKQVEDVGRYSVKDYLYDPNYRMGMPFRELRYTHPAIFMVQFSLAQVLLEEGINPDYVIGTSLGEFVSMAISGVLDYRQILEILIRQSRMIEAQCETGGMLAILASPKLYDTESVLFKQTEMAALNYDKHFVISGEREKVKEIEKYLKEHRISVSSQLLDVSYGFHSKAMEPIKEEFLKQLRNYKYRIPTIKYISCVLGKPIDRISEDYIWDVVREPIRFRDTIMRLEEQHKQGYIYIDLGPSGTLSSFAKQITRRDSRSEAYSTMTPFHKDLSWLEKIKKMYKDKVIQIEGKEKKMIAYLFPGQGSQYVGMGAELFDEFPEVTQKADAILGYSIKELCVKDPYNQLNQTQYTQPALYTVNALHYLKKIKETGITPDFLAGHSLGEYNALLAAGGFDFETGLKLVKKRGELMGLARNGGMAAVIGLNEEKIKEVLDKYKLSSIDIANLNTPSQIVLAGPKQDIEGLHHIFEAEGARMYHVLKVSGAFHSRYMQQSKEEFSTYINSFTYQDLKIPVLSNYTARPYKNRDIAKNLIEQMTSSVKWTELTRLLLGRGEVELVEVGPGKVLAGLIRSIKQEAEPLVLGPEDESDWMIADKSKPRDFTSGHGQLSAPVNHTNHHDEIKGDMNEGTDALQHITASSLGCQEFRKDYNLKYAYVTGAMYKGIASKEMVVKVGRAGMMGFFGTGGLSLVEIEEAIRYIQAELKNGEAYGMNLLHDPSDPENEERMVDLYLKYGVSTIEASAYMSVNHALVKYRAYGLERDANGRVRATNRIMAKVSRPEVAEAFLSPAPERVIKRLVEENKISTYQAEMLRELPIADDICVEADSGGHTDQGVAYALMPAMMHLRNAMMEKYGYQKKIRIGAAGGIGTPEAALAAFILGADFILTGSINQCTVESGTSNSVKELLSQINVQDTVYAPAGDMFEMGAKVQVLKRGILFPSRANKLYDLYQKYQSLDEIDEKTQKQLQEKYFKKSFEEIFEECKAYYPSKEIIKAEDHPKHKMAMVFKWYFAYSTRLALQGMEENKVDYQVHCGPALGAFNQWIKNTPLESWKNRYVDELGLMLMEETANLFASRIKQLAFDS